MLRWTSLAIDVCRLPFGIRYRGMYRIPHKTYRIYRIPYKSIRYAALLSRASLFGDRLLRFCDDNTLNIIDKVILPNDAYTYVSYSWGSTSWLDHVIGGCQTMHR